VVLGNTPPPEDDDDDDDDDDKKLIERCADVLYDVFDDEKEDGKNTKRREKAGNTVIKYHRLRLRGINEIEIWG